MSKSIVTLPIDSKVLQREILQWGVFDTRTGHIIRTHLTRAKARNYARRSEFYIVVRRPITIGLWE
jgi:hypothetical protein